MLSLNLRPARLNQDHTGKSHEKDGEITKLLTYGLDDIPLDAQELGVITREPHAARAMYNDDKGVLRPIFTCFKPREFDEDIEGAYVMVRLHGGTEIKHTSCKVTTAPALDQSLAEFYSQFGEIVDVELRGEMPGAQKDLPLNTHGTGEQTETPKKRKPRGPNGGSMPKSTQTWDEDAQCYVDSEGNPIEGALGNAKDGEQPPTH